MTIVQAYLIESCETWLSTACWWTPQHEENRLNIYILSN